MHRLLTTWLQKTEITLSKEIVSYRSDSISDVLKNLTKNKIIDLIKLAFGFPSNEVSFSPKLREIFQSHDITFIMEGNDKELHILAGATLATLLDEKKTSMASFAAAAILSASFRRKRNGPVIEQLTDYAEQYISERSREVREIGEIPKIDAYSISKELTALQKATSVSDASTLGNLVSAINKINNVSQHLPKILDLHKVFKEESNIMWWIINRRIYSIDKEFHNLTKQEAVLYLPFELVEMVDIYPSSPAAYYILQQILLSIFPGGNEQNTSISAVIAFIDKQWKEELLGDIKQSDLLDVCPGLYSITKAGDTGSEWVKAVIEKIRITPDIEMPITELSYQFYLEFLLLRMAKL
ncbi:GTPase-associated system all-helical protein GASH [Deinococcus misasensis]|uniref:GTPase-associated system all-helical protein GASH n=1 Tax=Deinococcus misasensis TaxID=392413 RepID=UPI00054D37EF|nr:GTPase-associated system all-helical protein GASH [Deinococcus misasensis]